MKIIHKVVKKKSYAAIFFIFIVVSLFGVFASLFPFFLFYALYLQRQNIFFLNMAWFSVGVVMVIFHWYVNYNIKGLYSIEFEEVEHEITGVKNEQ